MLMRLSLRTRILLIFAGLAGVFLVTTGLGLCQALRQLGHDGIPAETAADPLVQAALIAGFGAIAVTAGVWYLFDRNVAQPLETIAGALRTGHIPDAETVRYLGDLGPAAGDAAETRTRAAEELAEAVARHTEEIACEKAALEAILANIGAGAVMTDADGRVVLYNTQAARLLPGLVLDRPLARHVARDALDAALTRLAAGAREAKLVCTLKSGVSLNGRLRALDEGSLLILEDGTCDSEPLPAGLTYDFALSRCGTSSRLADLTCVVFDTETTGLSATDRIVQIAALRIVRGKLTGEQFETLVDPGRMIPSASTRIHGITDDMVAGAPDMTAALEAFHHFAEDSVLVAHNAPFDMGLLRAAFPETDVHFDNRVLDTVILSAMVWGNSVPHTLDALTERLGISIPPEERHTAMGDTIATAAAFQKLIPALEKKGFSRFEDILAAAPKYRRLIADANPTVSA